MTYDPIAAKRARLQREIRDAQTQLDALELVPAEDAYGDGTVIHATISWRGQPRTYVFLKIVDETLRAADRWYHTGWVQHSQHAARGSSFQLTYFNGWVELQKWLTETGRVVETWTVMAPQQPKSTTEDITDITALRGY